MSHDTLPTRQRLPVVHHADGLRRLFDRIATTRVPRLVGGRFLADIDLNESNDRDFIVTLRRLGFIDSAGRPTDRWRKYRHSRAERQTELRDAIQQAFEPLYEALPDAHQQPQRDIDQALLKLTKTRSGQARTSRTFRTLCDIAGWGPKPRTSEPVIPVLASPNLTRASHPQLVIAVPAMSSTDDYLRFFTALRAAFWDQ